MWKCRERVKFRQRRESGAGVLKGLFLKSEVSQVLSWCRLEPVDDGLNQFMTTRTGWWQLEKADDRFDGCVLGNKVNGRCGKSSAVCWWDSLGLCRVGAELRALGEAEVKWEITFNEFLVLLMSLQKLPFGGFLLLFNAMSLEIIPPS